MRGYINIMAEMPEYAADVEERKILLADMITYWRENGTLNSPDMDLKITVLERINERLNNGARRLGLIENKVQKAEK